MIELAIFELFIEDAEWILVGCPAIEKDIMYFNEQPVKVSLNEDKMI